MNIGTFQTTSQPVTGSHLELKGGALLVLAIAAVFSGRAIEPSTEPGYVAILLAF
jgi:hypothetical protein